MATVTLHSQRTLVNSAVAAGTAKLAEDGKVTVHGSTTADTLNLPLSVDTGYKFWVLNSGTQAITLAAGSGESLGTGSDTSLAEQGSNVFCVKTGSTTWAVSKPST